MAQGHNSRSTHAPLNGSLTSPSMSAGLMKSSDCADAKASMPRSSAADHHGLVRWAAPAAIPPNQHTPNERAQGVRCRSAHGARDPHFFLKRDELPTSLSSLATEARAFPNGAASEAEGDSAAPTQSRWRRKKTSSVRLPLAWCAGVPPLSPRVRSHHACASAEGAGGADLHDGVRPAQRVHRHSLRRTQVLYLHQRLSEAL